MRVELLGPLRVLADDGAQILLPTARRERAVLSILALRAPSNVPAGELIRGIWGDEPPRAAGKNVQTYISTLRKVLPAGTIETTSSGYRLRLTRESIDIGCFEDAVLEGMRAVQAGEAATAIGLLREALATWRGEPLLELNDQPVGMAESARLAELHRAAEESLIDARLDAGEHAEIIGELEAAISAEPLREKRWAQLMVALYRCGRQADALRAFQRLQSMLAEELGIDPSRELQDLEQAILRQDQHLEGRSSIDPAVRTPTAADQRERLPLARWNVCRSLEPLLENQFVGRGAELSEIERLLTTGVTSRAPILIMGEPGIGKTSLLAQLAERAAALRVLCLYGRCDEENIVPYQPFVEALRSLLTCRERETALSGALRNELVRILPEVQELISGDFALSDPFDPATAQGHICRAIVEALNLLASEGPLLLFLDDVQWADSGSLQMLRAVLTAAELSGEIGLVATIRNEPSSIARVEAAVADPFHHRGVVQIWLTGLGAEEIAQLVSPGATQVEVAEAHDAEVLRTLTGGNPLFATQLIRNEREAGLSQIGPFVPDDGALPFGLSSVIDGRLRRLPDDVRQVLEVSAILGNSGSVALLQATLRTVGLDEGMLEAIDTAISHGFVIINESMEFVFTHELVRRRLVAELGLLQRKRLHLAVGESLQVAPDPDSVAQGAFHRRAAAPLGDFGEAARWTLRSAIRSFYNGAFDNARKELEDGLNSARAFGAQSSLECSDLLLALAGVAMAMGDNDLNKECCLKAADIARSRRSTERLALVAIQLASAGVLGSGDEDVLGICAEALSAPDHLLPSIRAQLLAVAAYYKSTVAGAGPDDDVQSADALRLAEGSQSPESAAFVGFFRFWILVALGQAAEARALSEKLLAFGNLPDRVHDEGVTGLLRASRYWGRSYARRCRFAISMIDGDREEIESEVAALEATAGRGASQLRQMTRVMRVAISLLDGDLEAAESGNSDVASFVGTDQNMFSAYVAQLFQLRLLQDRLDEIEPLVRAALNTSEGWMGFKVALAFCCAERGDVPETQEILGELKDHGAFRVPRTIIRMTLLGLIAEIMAELDDGHGSREIYELLAPYSGQFVVAGWGVVCSGSVDHFLGILAGTWGEPDLAVKHFDAAIERQSALRAPALLADTFYWKARTQLTRPRNFGREWDDGVACLTQGVAIADRYGLRRLERRLATLKSSKALV
jgi:DNA-binding SARP family transcriptional activator